MRPLSLAACFLGCLLVSIQVHASQRYPELLQSRLALGYRPDCALCHSTADGSDTSVVTEFGLSMVGFGLRANDPMSLDVALRASLAAGRDTDSDGLTDIDELVLNTDPSGPALSRAAGPTYGCSIGRCAARGSTLPSAVAALILIGLSARLAKGFRLRGRRDSET